MLEATQTPLEPPYYQNSVVTIRWEEETRSVLVTVKGVLIGQGSEYRAGLEKGLELFQRKNSRHWLGDSHEARMVDQPDREWVEKDLVPRLIKAGLRKAAMVVPEDVRVKMGFKQYMNKLVAGKQQVELVYFSKISEAREWLLSK